MRRSTALAIALTMCLLSALMGCGEQTESSSVTDAIDIELTTEDNQVQDGFSDVLDQNITTEENTVAEEEESKEYYLKMSRGTNIIGDFEVEYDIYGNIVRRHNEYGTDTYEYEYNNDGRMVRKTADEDDTVHVTEYEYECDENGNVIKESRIVDGEYKGWVEYEYDFDGNLLKQIEYYNTSASEDMVNWVEIVQRDITEYNSFGKPARTESYMGDELWGRDIYKYDENGNLILTENYDKDEELRTIFEYEYDEAGNIIKQTYESRWVDPVSITITEYKYEFDDNGNKIKETEYYEDGTSYVTEFEYELMN